LFIFHFNTQARVFKNSVLFFTEWMIKKHEYCGQNTVKITVLTVFHSSLSLKTRLFHAAAWELDQLLSPLQDSINFSFNDQDDSHLHRCENSPFPLSLRFDRWKLKMEVKHTVPSHHKAKRLTNDNFLWGHKNIDQATGIDCHGPNSCSGYF